MAIKTMKIMCDFETTTTPDDVRVWGGCAVNIDTFEVMHISNSIESFITYLQDKNTTCYWHNLKFDGEFLISFLLHNGYKLSKEKNDKTFDCLITDDGIFYSITIIFEKKNKKYKKATIYDSLKKLPFKVAQIPKAFGLNESKLSIDYDEFRPIGHELTDQEKEYIIADCKIVAQALNIQLDKGLTKMTNASDAMAHFKETIGRDRFEKLFPVFPIEMDTDIRRAYKGGYTHLKSEHKNARGLKGITFDFNSLYPSVMYDELLPWGYPVFFEGEYEYDERFPLYIVRIRADFELKPGHLPIIQLKKNRLFKETEYLVNSKDPNGKYTYPEFTVTSIDLELIKEHYELIDPEYKCGYKFKGKTGIFKEYIDYWTEEKRKAKESGNKAMYSLCKIMLNSLYGRFALNPIVINKIPYLDQNGVVKYDCTGNTNPKVKVKEETKKRVEEYKGHYGIDYREPVYTPMACFITAYARKKIITTCQSVYDRFIYCDTDSCHIIGNEIPEHFDVHDTRLGALKNEGRFVDSKYIRSKTYMETMEEKTKDDSLKTYAKLLNKGFDNWREDGYIIYHNTIVTCAGMPDDIKYTDLYSPDEGVTYETFKEGASFFGKLVPKRYKGGIVLTPSDFTIH